MALGLLSLIEAFDPGIVADGEVGCLDIRPGQILVPVLGIALAFLLALLNFWLPTQRQYEE